MGGKGVGNLAGEGSAQSRFDCDHRLACSGPPPPLYFARRWHESRAERRTVSQNIYLELEDTQNGLDTTKSEDLIVVIPDDGKEIYFMNRMFNHDFYDSLVFSGRINFVKPELQQHLQDVFHYIKDHDSYLQKIRELENYDDGDNGTDLTRYYHMLGNTDNLLRGLIPELMCKLKKEYKGLGK